MIDLWIGNKFSPMAVDFYPFEGTRHEQPMVWNLYMDSRHVKFFTTAVEIHIDDVYFRVNCNGEPVYEYYY